MARHSIKNGHVVLSQLSDLDPYGDLSNDLFNRRGEAVESNPTSDRWRRRLRRIPVLVAIGIVVNILLVLLMSGWSAFESLLALPPLAWIGAGMLAFVPWITGSLRLMIWSRFFGHPLRFKNSLRVVLSTEVVAAATPTAVGGAPAKTAMLYGHGVPTSTSILMTALGSIEDGIFFALAIPLAVWFAPGDAFSELAGHFQSGLPWWVPAVAVATIVGIGVLFMRYRGSSTNGEGHHGLLDSIRRVVHQIREGFRLIVQRGRSRLLVTLPLTVIQWSARYLIVSVISIGLGSPVDPLLLFVLQCAVFTLMTVVPSPGATGGAEAGFLLIHRSLATTATLGPLMAGWRFFTFLLPVGVASLALLSMGRTGAGSGGGSGSDPQTKRSRSTLRAG